MQRPGRSWCRVAVIGGGRRHVRSSRVRHAIGTGVALLLLLMTALLAGTVASGAWRMDPMLSGSMRPAYPLGSVVLAERVPLAALQRGDVVLFSPPWAPGQTYAHRIIALRRVAGVTTIRTKGDANSVADPAPVRLTGRFVYEARAAVPVVGYVAVWAHSSAGELELAAIALMTAMGVAAWTAKVRRRIAKVRSYELAGDGKP